jgi:hypothetical protein
METSSYASGSVGSTIATVLNYSTTLNQKKTRKEYRLKNYLRQGVHEKVNLKK